MSNRGPGSSEPRVQCHGNDGFDFKLLPNYNLMPSRGDCVAQRAWLVTPRYSIGRVRCRASVGQSPRPKTAPPILNCWATYHCVPSGTDFFNVCGSGATSLALLLSNFLSARIRSRTGG
jgi:hypothetical protein